MKRDDRYVGGPGYDTGNYKYTKCCGKVVHYNYDEVPDGRGGTKEVKKPGYHCSRCKKPVTVYGNPMGEDKEKMKEAQKVKGRGHKVLPNGDLQLIDMLYKYTDENEKLGHYSDKYVIFDMRGNYMTTIKLEHTNGRIYEVKEPFVNRLLKEKLSGQLLSSFTGMKMGVADLQDPAKFKQALINLGWRFNKNGITY